MRSLRAENITKRFGEKLVLDNISCIFDDGIFCVTGPSGCGKTTLLRIIAGLEIPDSGVVSETGKISVMFQEDRLFPWMTAVENASAGSDSASAEKALRALGLEQSFRDFPETMSGGMRRRVALARAVAAGGDLLLLDEPFNGLDPENIAKAGECIVNAGFRTIVVVSHSQEALPFDNVNVFGLLKNTVD